MADDDLGYLRRLQEAANGAPRGGPPRGGGGMDLLAEQRAPIPSFAGWYTGSAAAADPGGQEGQEGQPDPTGVHAQAEKCYLCDTSLLRHMPPVAQSVRELHASVSHLCSAETTYKAMARFCLHERVDQEVGYPITAEMFANHFLRHEINEAATVSANLAAVSDMLSVFYTDGMVKGADGRLLPPSRDAVVAFTGLVKLQQTLLASRRSIRTQMNT